ncbi:MAG: SHOCT domain-containing protein [Polyangiaceae bacterium]|jgi:hypothetical protein|nr:SHOCT domain-containing protein [Polyangiaceae bacterium]
MEISPGAIALLVFILSAVLASDANGLGYKKGDVKGIANLSPGEWFVCCLIFCVVTVPIYALKRGEMKEAGRRRREAAMAAQRGGYYPTQGYQYAPPQQGYVAPPQQPQTDAHRMLASLAEMRAQGLINDAEYEQKKAQILSRIG